VLGEQLTIEGEVGTMRVGAGRLDASGEIARLRAEGMGTTEIARSLNARGVPTASGRGMWWPATVRRHSYQREAWAAYMRSYRARHR
jgi:hypothetical protein